MQRLTARFLLLFTLAGTFVPLALAATAAPPHACCIRKTAHQCHSSSTEAGQRTVRGIGCCNHDCCHALTTSQWAHPRGWPAAIIAQSVDGRIAESRAATPATELRASQSTRAPPPVSIA
jgi:hypothetical protein